MPDPSPATIILAMGWVRLIAVERCRPGGGTFVEHEGRELAVFLLDPPGTVAVIDNACPHASGNLSGGEVADGVVTCPWHQWQFDLTTGQCVHSRMARVRRYPARIEDGYVWVQIAGAPEREDPGGA
ncbi:MAG: Rieske (2Fe-2S) protein [Planctomycetota bacterium]|nr:MAG: Rieske (2Fe-2S) protein [Planctomycetota bacterium]